MYHQSGKNSKDIDEILEDGVESIIRDLCVKNMEFVIQQTINNVKNPFKRHKIDSKYSSEEEMGSEIADLKARLEEVIRAKEAETERANKAEAVNERAKKAMLELKMMINAEMERANRAQAEMETTKSSNQYEKDHAKRVEEIAIAKLKKAESKVKELTKKRDVYLKWMLDKDLETTKAQKDVNLYKKITQLIGQLINSLPQPLQITITDDSTISDKEEPDSDEEKDSEKSTDESESEDEGVHNN